MDTRLSTRKWRLLQWGDFIGCSSVGALHGTPPCYGPLPRGCCSALGAPPAGRWEARSRGVGPKGLLFFLSVCRRDGVHRMLPEDGRHNSPKVELVCQRICYALAYLCYDSSPRGALRLGDHTLRAQWPENPRL